MIVVVGPDSSPPGATICVTVTGASGPVTVSAFTSSERLAATVVQEPSGVWRICVALPKGIKGSVTLRIADKTGTVHRAISVAP